MNRKDARSRMATLGRIMTAIGLLGAVLVVALRVWLTPAQQDTDTGLFASNTAVIIIMLFNTGTSFFTCVKMLIVYLYKILTTYLNRKFGLSHKR